MRVHSTAGWAEDVFGYDDYRHSRAGQADLRPPLPGVPYLVSEAVGALDGSPTFRWTDPPAVLASQALLHGDVHNAAARPGTRYAGLLAWAGIDYASMHHDGPRIWRSSEDPRRAGHVPGGQARSRDLPVPGRPGGPGGQCCRCSAGTSDPGRRRTGRGQAR